MRNLFPKMLAIVVFLALSLWVRPVTAFDVPGTLTGGQNGIFQGQAFTGVSLDQILAASGLNSEKYGACTSPAILGALADSIKNFNQILEGLIIDTINAVYTALIHQLIYCNIADLNIPLIGNPLPKCTTTVGSDIKAALIGLKNREIQQNFVARCVAAIAMKNSADTVTRLMQQQGAYGEGPAWVTSWEAVPKVEAQRAQRRFYTELVNTDICPYMRDQVLDYFGVPKDYRDTPPSLQGIEDVDTGNPFTLRAGCTLPNGFDPNNLAANTQGLGYLAAVDLMSQSQNNFNSFIDMAQAELNNQTATLIAARTNDYISGGGVGSINDCTNYAPDGSCLAGGPNKQTGGTLRDQNAAVIQAQYNWVNSTDAQKKAISDITIEIADRLFNLANAPLPLHIELGKEDNPANISPLTPTPSPSAVPGDGSPNDPECTGGDPRCTCVKNDETVQSTITGFVSSAIGQVIENDPQFFSPAGSSTIAPGVSFRTVLQAICSVINANGQTICEPSPGQDDEIIILGGATTISVDVITSDGTLRTNGGRAIAACEPGVQD